MLKIKVGVIYEDFRCWEYEWAGKSHTSHEELVDNIKSYFLEGNMACDCNKLEGAPCGDSIKTRCLYMNQYNADDYRTDIIYYNMGLDNEKS